MITQRACRLWWRGWMRAPACRRRSCSTMLRRWAEAWLRRRMQLRGVVVPSPEEGASGLSRAPLWGLVRSARAEHPDRRLQLVDVDAVPADAVLLRKLVSTPAEPELALRHGAGRAPRL